MRGSWGDRAVNDGSVVLWLLAGVWFAMGLNRLAKSVETIGSELRRLREIAEGNRR